MNFKEKSITTLALVVVLVPYLGFPGSWENAFLIISGLLIIGLTITEWIERTRRAARAGGVSNTASEDMRHASSPREYNEASVGSADETLNYSDAAQSVDETSEMYKQPADTAAADNADYEAAEDDSSTSSFLKW